VPEGKPLAVVRPKDTKEIQDLVNLAREMEMNLVPASSGTPHFRGGTVPSGGGTIVDLSGMDKIVRMDRRNRVAIVEPGITFAELKQEAERAGLKVNMPLLPRQSKSVLASYLEREPILIPKYHWDMTDPLLCIEVVFGTGDMFRTGSAAGPGSLEDQWKAGAAQKNPQGPTQTDLVRMVQGSQGTMGIVAWGSVKLEVMPQIRTLYFVPGESLEKLIDFSYQALRLRLGDEFLILNSFALASILRGEPETIKSLASRQAPFTLIYCVAGYDYFPELRVVHQEQDISAVAQRCGVEIEKNIPGANGIRMMEILDNPSTEPYWKLRFKGGFREIFFLAHLDQVPAFIGLMEEILGRYDYPHEEMGIYIQPILQGRACHLEFNLYYDPSDEKETARVEKLFQEASTALSEAGGFFSRPYGPWAQTAYARCPDSVDTLIMLKGIFDPAGVFNRGKLCFEEV
jgi:FAD/FMN-containing dehydrogenase